MSQNPDILSELSSDSEEIKEDKDVKSSIRSSKPNQINQSLQGTIESQGL
jgi:hypothetical protein